MLDEPSDSALLESVRAVYQELMPNEQCSPASCPQAQEEANMPLLTIMKVASSR